MILACCFGKERCAMCDMYKNIMNSMPNKKNIVVIIPSAYGEDEFSNEFRDKIVENITNIKDKKKRLFYLIPYYLKLKKILKEYPIQQIYFQNSTFIYDMIVWLIYRNHVQYTLWLHDPVLHEGASKLEHWYRRASLATYFHSIKTFILSYQAANDVVKNSAELYQFEGKMEVLYLPQMPEMEFVSLKEASIPIKYDYIFYGRIEEYKGLELFIEAFDQTANGRKLLIVGTGRDEENIKTKVKNNPQIEFLNHYVESQDLARYIMMSKCVVLPYKSATGSQTVAIANYYGRMVLATKVGCFPEYIQEGENGFFIENYTVEAMKIALEKTDEYLNICTPEKIQKVYDKFNIKKIASQLYQKIIS